MQEDDCIAVIEKVFCRCGATGAGGEIVDEADHLVFQRYGSAAGGYENDAAGVRGMAGDEFAGEGGVFLEDFWAGVGGEVVVFHDGGSFSDGRFAEFVI